MGRNDGILGCRWCLSDYRSDYPWLGIRVKGMTNSSSVITEAGGRQNMYAIEPRTYIDPNYTSYAKDAELSNARWAMIGFL